MTSSRMLRPVLTLLAGGLVASCGSADGDPARFATMAQHVADISLDGGAGREKPPVEATAAERGLRPAYSESALSHAGLKVEVMDPHELWDARDGLRPAFPATRPVVQPAAQRIAAQPAMSVSVEEGRPVTAQAQTRKVIQLGAYSSPEAARAAWAAIRTGQAGSVLGDLTPDFEAVKVDGRSLVRLRVSAPPAAAAAVCRAAEVTDPWCMRGA